jgi:hypothetical protein
MTEKPALGKERNEPRMRTVIGSAFRFDSYYSGTSWRQKKSKIRGLDRLRKNSAL